MAVITANVSCRLSTEADIPALIRLWEEEAGWGGLSTEKFTRWFVDTPYGKSLIVVAEDEEGKVVGQLVYAPSRIWCGGTELRALRGAAPILSKTLRGQSIRSLSHPAFALIKAGFDLAADAGYQLVYSFPAYGWVGLFRQFPNLLPNPTEVTAYDCYSISLTDAATLPAPNTAYDVRLQPDFTDDYDDLWQQAIGQWPLHCSMVRKAFWLKWAAGGLQVLETRRTADNALLGYAALKKDSGMLVDVFARDAEALQQVYRHTIWALHHANPQRLNLPFDALKSMVTPHNEAIVQNLGYTKEAFQFAFGTYLLDTTLDFDTLKTEHWYLTPLK